MAADKVRDGGNAIVLAARALVILVTTWHGALRQRYGAGSAIDLLCVAIIALGNLLPAADEEVIERGGDNTAPEVNPDAIPGQAEGLPLPPDDPA